MHQLYASNKKNTHKQTNNLIEQKQKQKQQNKTKQTNDNKGNDNNQ